jgi:hypothetical protein
MRTLILVVLAALCAPLAIAQTADQKFQQGNALYQQGRYAEAVVASKRSSGGICASGASLNLGMPTTNRGSWGSYSEL